MSRIHEALQRAYLERGRTPVMADFQVAQGDMESIEPPPPLESLLEEPPIVKTEIVLEDITQHDWHPSTVSFPTLVDRGAGVEQFRSLRSHVYQARYEAPL